MSLLDTLQWYWDLSSADASIVDQHSGLSLPVVGTTSTLPTGGPDGGPCIDFGNATGKYRNSAVAKTVSYDDGFTANIWAYSTAGSNNFNSVLNHRNVGGGAVFYFFMAVRSSISGLANLDLGVVFSAGGTAERLVTSSQESLNVWQMLTLADNGTTASLYRNGTLVATSSTALGARDTGTAGFAIGGSSWQGTSSQNDHRGRLAMAGVWNEPLDVGQIAQLYNGGDGLRYADLDISGGGIIPILRQHYAAQGAR